MTAAARAAIAGLKEFGPYAAIELVLPGGTLIALLLWLYRRRQSRRNLIREHGPIVG